MSFVLPFDLISQHQKFVLDEVMGHAYEIFKVLFLSIERIKLCLLLEYTPWY
jgi:hypothetical protein